MQDQTRFTVIWGKREIQS